MHVWDLASGAIVKTVPFASQVMDLEMSRNGSVVTVAAGRQVAFLDAHTCVGRGAARRGQRGACFHAHVRACVRAHAVTTCGFRTRLA